MTTWTQFTLISERNISCFQHSTVVTHGVDRSVVDPDSTHQIERFYPDPNPPKHDKLDPDKDPHQSDKLVPDPLPFADDKPKCMENDPNEALFLGFRTLFGS